MIAIAIQIAHQHSVTLKCKYCYHFRKWVWIINLIYFEALVLRFDGIPWMPSVKYIVCPTLLWLVAWRYVNNFITAYSTHTIIDAFISIIIKGTITIKIKETEQKRIKWNQNCYHSWVFRNHINTYTAEQWWPHNHIEHTPRKKKRRKS